MMDSPIKTYFSTKEVHKFILFIASVIFVSSLFVPVQSLETPFVQKGSFTFVIIGLIWWFLFDIIAYGVDRYVEDEYHHSDPDKENVAHGWSIAWNVILFLGFVIGIGIVFS